MSWVPRINGQFDGSRRDCIFEVGFQFVRIGADLVQVVASLARLEIVGDQVGETVDEFLVRVVGSSLRSS